jgi:hypothetical protein
MAVVAVLVVVGASAIALISWYNGSNYVNSSAAQVSAPLAPVGSLAAGTLASWSATVGERVTPTTVLGTVDAVGSGGTATTVNLVAGLTGTVVESSAVAGQTVDPGVPLAYVAKLADPTVVAYIKENNIQNVQVGQSANVRVSALPNTTIAGTVQAITLGTAAEFSLLPAAAPSGSLNTVTQYIPVTISLSGNPGGLLPGESATVRIHIR